MQQKENIEETIGHAFILTQIMKTFDEAKKQPKKIICIQEDKMLEFIKMIIIGHNVQEQIVFDTCYIQEEQKNKKKNKESFKELIKNF